MGSSDYKNQETGIRQGCPLSPYFFVVVMTVIMHDVHRDLEKGSLQTGFYDEYPFLNCWEFLYADDTLILGKTDGKIEKILQIIEEESLKYDMFLNKSKSVIIAMNCFSTVKYKNRDFGY